MFKLKILFIAPKFYNYHSAVTKSLESRGFSVTFYPEMEQSLLYRFAVRASRRLQNILERRYLLSILEGIQEDTFDIVFVIRGGYFSKEWLEKLHFKLPKAKFFMYQWDSVRQNNYLPLVKYFDRVQTFDMHDAKKYNIEYLPLFYTQEYKDLQNEKYEKLYDLVFFGAYHSDRLEVIKYIEILFKANKLRFRYHLFITKLALFRLLITGVITFKDLHYFKTYSLSTDEIIEGYRQTEAVLDVELSIQNGLTIRTFESLGAGLKLVTTNENIKKERFYDSNTIMYIDRKNIEVDLEFFHKPKKKDFQFDEYFIDSWLRKIIG